MSLSNFCLSSLFSLSLPLITSITIVKTQNPNTVYQKKKKKPNTETQPKPKSNPHPRQSRCHNNYQTATNLVFKPPPSPSPTSVVARCRLYSSQTHLFSPTLPHHHIHRNPIPNKPSKHRKPLSNPSEQIPQPIGKNHNHRT